MAKAARRHAVETETGRLLTLRLRALGRVATSFQKVGLTNGGQPIARTFDTELVSVRRRRCSTIGPDESVARFRAQLLLRSQVVIASAAGGRPTVSAWYV
jgi:hypothetical protein